MGSQLQNITGPDWAASYLINGDASSLEADDVAAIEAWLEREGVAQVVYVTDDEPRFTWSYAMYFPEGNCAGGNVVEYVCELRG